MKSVEDIRRQWHRVANKNATRAEKLMSEVGSPLEIMTSVVHFMTETERARLHKLQGINTKILELERAAARDRILAKRQKKVLTKQ